MVGYALSPVVAGLAIGIALAGAPGPVQAMLLAEAARGGVGRGLRALAGASFTFGLLLLCLAMGVSIVVPQGLVLRLLRLTGGILLVWLAVDAIRSGWDGDPAPERGPSMPAAARGSLAILLNPGAWLFLGAVASPLLATATQPRWPGWRGVRRHRPDGRCRDRRHGRGAARCQRSPTRRPAVQPVDPARPGGDPDRLRRLVAARRTCALKWRGDRGSNASDLSLSARAVEGRGCLFCPTACGQQTEVVFRKGSTFDGAVAAVPLRRNPPFDKASLHSSYGMKTLSGSPTPTSHSPGSGSLLTSARRSEIIA